MLRDSIIILETNGNYEAWGNLKDLCKNHYQFSYSYLKRLKFPFESHGYKFTKIKFRTVLI